MKHLRRIAAAFALLALMTHAALAASGTITVLDGNAHAQTYQVTVLPSGSFLGNMNVCDPSGSPCGGVNGVGLKVDASGATVNANVTNTPTVTFSGSPTVTIVQPTGSNAHFVCDSGCSSSTAPADESAFTAGTTPQSPVGGFFQTTPTNNALSSGQMGALQVTANRALFVNPRNSSGTEIATASNPFRIDPTGTTPQPVTQSTSPWVNNTTQLGGTAIDTNSGNKSAGTQRVVLATDQPQLTNALKVDGSAVTQPVSYGSGTFTTSDSHFPAAAALSDALSNPTTTLIGSNLLGWDSTNSVWRRVQVDAGTGTVKVDPGTVTVTGTVTANQGGAPWSVNGATTPADSFSNPTTAILDFGLIAGWDATNSKWQRIQVDAGTGTIKVDPGTVTVTGTVTTSPPANASTNVAQFGGTNVSTGTGAGGAGIPRVTISNDSSLAANQSVNTAQFGGTNVVTGTGASGAGIPRVTISNDSSLAANQSVNVNQIAGAAVATAASGVQKVGVTGNAGAAMDAAGQNAAAPANELVGGCQYNAQPTQITGGNVSPCQADQNGNHLAALRDSARRPIGESVPGVNSPPLVVALAPSLPPRPANPLQPGGFGGQFGPAIRGAKQSPSSYDNAVVVALSPNPSLQCPFVAPISQTASATVITGQSGLKAHMCSVKLISATAQNYSIAEGTGSNCGTGTTFLDGGSGGTNAVVAGGGESDISPSITLPMQIAGDNVCVLQSSTGNISGHITYGFYPP